MRQCKLLLSEDGGRKMYKGNKWQNEINVSDFIDSNYSEYLGDESFLNGTTEKTRKVWNKCLDLIKEEIKQGVIDIEVNKVSGINNFDAGYIDKENEVVVGLQTDEPLKRIVNPYGGIRMVQNALAAYGYKLNPEIDKHFNMYRKNHNQGVFDAY